MPSQIMNIGPVPAEENAAQVGAPCYEEHSQRECRVFKRMLERLYPIASGCPATLLIKSFPHDFGSYREVCVRYEDTDRSATLYAYALESGMPMHWDAIARYELIWLERLEAFERAIRADEMSRDELPEIFRSGQLPPLPVNQTFSQLLAAFPL